LAKLKESEVWPFQLNEGYLIPIYEDKFYGFYECGGLFINTGSDTPEELVNAIKRWYDEPTPYLVTTDPEGLGEYSVTVLSGRQFLDRLYYIIGYQSEGLEDYGAWSFQKAV
jgi:hypothetical protein